MLNLKPRQAGMQLVHDQRPMASSVVSLKAHEASRILSELFRKRIYDVSRAVPQMSQITPFPLRLPPGSIKITKRLWIAERSNVAITKPTLLENRRQCFFRETWSSRER